jgi:hypothetical protein
LSDVAEAMLSRVLEEAVNRIARKVAEGKKLSDQEIVMLYLDIIMRSNGRRFESIEKRIDLVYSEVSSIKTDIIKLMKEYMEMLYGGKKD